jgi:putative hemolysin
MKLRSVYVGACFRVTRTAMSAKRGGRRANFLFLTLSAFALLLMTVLTGASAPVHHSRYAVQNITIGNPAAVYCTHVMGFDYEVVVDAEGGEVGVCILPGGETCDQWDFYSGLCGSRHNYCARQGYRTEVRSDGGDPFVPTYAVCVTRRGREIGSVAQASTLLLHLTATCPESYLDLDAPQVTEPPQLDMWSSLPSSFDWRNYQNENWMTSVKNQRACGSCWAFAVTGVIEAHHNIIRRTPNLDLNLSEQHLLSCSGAGSCSGGQSPPAMAYVQTQGVVDEFCMPYTGSEGECRKCEGWWNRLTLIDEMEVFHPSGTSLRQRLVTYGPVWAYMGMSPYHLGYFDSAGRYRCGRDSNTGHYGIDHAVIVVGYDDPGGYWIVKNSWGSSWNEDGYFKVAYGACNLDRTLAGYPYLAPPTKASAVRPDGWTGPYTNNPSPGFRWDPATDSGSGMLGYYVALNHWTPTSLSPNHWWAGNVTEFTVPTALPDGQHTFAVTSKDRFGNVNPANTNVQGDAPYYTFYVDTRPPSSRVTALSQRQSQLSFRVEWSGSDAESGIANYDIQYRVGTSKTWVTWLSATSATDGVFTAPQPGIYFFRSRARDRAGNVESWPAGNGDTYTQVGVMLYLPQVYR